MCQADLATFKADLLAMGARATPQFTLKFKVGHGHAYAAALLERAIQLVAEQESVNNKCTTIVLANGAQITAYMKEMSDQTTVRVSHGIGAGRNLGEAAGNRIPLGGLTPSPATAAIA